MEHNHHMSITPTRPLTSPPANEIEQTILERNATFDQDKKTAAPWLEVKTRILNTLAPR